MAENRTSLESVRRWVVEHKLHAVGCLWLSGLAGSFAYNWSQPNMKTNVKVVHARLHAQALTLAALAGAAVVEYYDHKWGAKPEKYSKLNRERRLRDILSSFCHQWRLIPTRTERKNTQHALLPSFIQLQFH